MPKKYVLLPNTVDPTELDNERRSGWNRSQAVIWLVVGLVALCGLVAFFALWAAGARTKAVQVPPTATPTSQITASPTATPQPVPVVSATPTPTGQATGTAVSILPTATDRIVYLVWTQIVTVIVEQTVIVTATPTTP